MNEQALRQLNAAMICLSEGDRGACSIVFSLLWPVLVSFAERSLGVGPDADDAAQQALEKIFAQANSYDSTRSALAWALAITTYECKTVLQRRRRRREELLEFTNDPVDVDLTPQDVLEQNSMMNALYKVLAELSEQDRETLMHAFFEVTQSFSQNATFRKRKERALNRLRTAWRKLYGT